MTAPARLRARCAATAIALALPSTAYAAGYAVKETSASLQGVAYAGAAAGGEDISTMFNNPATIAFHEGFNNAAGVSLVFASGELDVEEASRVNGTQIDGDRTADSDEIGIVPSTYVSYQINDRFTAGLSINAPFGLVTDYGDDWAGRYHGTRSELLTVHVNPVIAFKPTPKIAIAAGPVLSYAKAELENAVDFGVIGNTLIPGQGGPVINGGTDGSAKVEGDEFAFGFTAGINVRPTERFRFGVGYRSEVEHDLDGDIDFDYEGNPINAAIGQAAGLVSQDASASATLPAQVMIGAAYDVTDRLTIGVEADWTDWSVFDELVIEGAQGQDITTTPQDWDDSWFLSVGGTYKATDQLTLRLGLAYDQGAAPDEKRTPRIPDADRMWVSAGLGYQLNDRIELNAAYTYVNVDDPDIDLNVADDPTGLARGNLQASGDAAVHILFVGGNIKF